MHFEDIGIVIELSEFQEKSLIVSCFSKSHGLVRGFIKSKKSVAQVSVGSLVTISYKARLATHLGTLQLELIKNFTNMLAFDRLKLTMLQSAVSIVPKALKDLDAHEILFDRFFLFLEELISTDDVLELCKHYVLLELEVLSSCGYGLDLSRCVVTESPNDLAYISPKSGCAVSKSAGLAYHNKLFKMPSFFIEQGGEININEALESINITGYFLSKRLLKDDRHGLPKIRDEIIKFLA